MDGNRGLVDCTALWVRAGEHLVRPTRRGGRFGVVDENTNYTRTRIHTNTVIYLIEPLELGGQVGVVDMCVNKTV